MVVMMRDRLGCLYGVKIYCVCCRVVAPQIRGWFAVIVSLQGLRLQNDVDVGVERRNVSGALYSCSEG